MSSRDWATRGKTGAPPRALGGQFGGGTEEGEERGNRGEEEEERSWRKASDSLRTEG